LIEKRDDVLRFGIRGSGKSNPRREQTLGPHAGINATEAGEALD
jgi:hypothetical protein